MKKFLSLVLALVMTMSLVTISAGAKTFEDDDAIDYIEAVEVMKAVKVIDGYADGNFNPSATLTRGAAAKIICNMILGPTTAGALSVTEAPFKDVPADNVFAGYISYCVSEGIISGYADGTFRPAATLTGYAFMKMLLGALGYDAAVEGYTGANWAVNVAKRALNIGLAKGLVNDFNGTKAVTRQEACLFAFNTLKSPMVKYPNSSTVTIGDIVISTSAAAEEIKGSAGDYDELGIVGDNDVQEFAEKYFSKLTCVTDEDAYGRPAHEWKVGKDSVGTYVDDAALIYTTAVKGNVLTDDIDDADLDIADEVSLTINSYVVSEDVSDDFEESLEKKEDMPYTGKGVQFELFTNSDDEIDQIVVIYTYLDQVESIVADKASTKSVNESRLDLVSTLRASAEKLSGDTCKAAGFKDVYGEVKVDDYVLVVPKADAMAEEEYSWGDSAFDATSAISIAIPETVKGVMTYKNTSTGTVKIDGTSYSLAETYSSICDVSDKAAVAYLDSFGYVMMVDGVANTADKSVAVLDAYQTLNKDGKIVPMIKGVTSNGETVTWQVDAEADAYVGGVYTYDEDSNVYSLTPVAEAEGAIDEDNAGATYAVTVDTETSTKKLETYTDSYSYFADTVKFIFINAEKGTATVKEGVQKVESTAGAVVINDDGDIATVYVLSAGSNSVGTSDALVFLAEETGFVRVYDKAAEEYVTLYTYDAYVNGEKIDDFYADETGCTGFYENEVDTDTGAYVLEGNEFTGDEDYLIVTDTLTCAEDDDWYKSTKLIVVGDVDLGITAKTVFADNTSNDITTLAALKTQVMTETDDVTVTALYDAETGNALYVYITDVTAHAEG